MTRSLVAIGRTLELAAGNFLRQAQLLELEELGIWMAHEDLVRRSSGYPEHWIALRLQGALEAARPGGATLEERHRLTDTYRSALHVLLLRREVGG